MKRKYEYKDLQYPPITPELKQELLIRESKEEIEIYFENIDMCKELGICVDCGQPVLFNTHKNKEYAKEYSVSGLCKSCQDKVFGI